MDSAEQTLSFPTSQQAGQALAELVAAGLKTGLKAQERVSLAVPGGRTPGPFFDALFAMDLPWSAIDLTLTDERWVDSSSPDSNHGLIERHRDNRPALAARFFPLKTSAATAREGMAGLQTRLAALPARFEAVILGVGEDGHIASLFPGQPVEQNGAPCLPGLAPSPPYERVSLSQSRLLASREIFLLFGGARKMDLVRRTELDLPVHRLIRSCCFPIRICHIND